MKRTKILFYKVCKLHAKGLKTEQKNFMKFALKRIVIKKNLEVQGMIIALRERQKTEPECPPKNWMDAEIMNRLGRFKKNLRKQKMPEFEQFRLLHSWILRIPDKDTFVRSCKLFASAVTWICAF